MSKAQYQVASRASSLQRDCPFQFVVAIARHSLAYRCIIQGLFHLHISVCVCVWTHAHTCVYMNDKLLVRPHSSIELQSSAPHRLIWRVEWRVSLPKCMISSDTQHHCRTGIVAQCVKPLPVAPASLRAPVWVSDIPLPVQPPAEVFEKAAADGLYPWDSVPTWEI